ncbi:rab-like protein 6 [Chanos chanos]|uniref:Rab-like protein 6 n=1 Tax=Chanos chanos TaxID=29144 RepID=A0A6J2WSN3_CHACN|nr:rab-like protein 6 [Chanos chanos]
MLSALKKLVGSEPGQVKEKTIPAGLQSMNQSLQRRFAKGVQYNMKIVIRGDRNTGKSTLWHRLQGKKFREEYIPTQEIQVTSIHWNYKTTDDVVKVEVWDVVDKGQKIPLPEGGGKAKKWGDTLKLENEPQEQTDTEPALDAEFLDVYKNCNGVIMMFDITKQWTYNYILRELPKVPTHVPVCVLGNHRDMGEHRVILPEDIRDFIAGLNRPLGSSYIHYAESSMKNGFGLKYLHRFFNIPFLQLQRETLLRQLETNQLDMDATLEELSVQQETEDQNYEIFLEMLDSRSKGYSSPGATNGQSPSSGSQSPVVPPSGDSTTSSSPGSPQPPLPSKTQPSNSPSPSPSPSPPPPPPPVSTESHAPELPAQSSSPSSSSTPGQPAPVTTATAPAPPQKRGFIARLFGSVSAPEPPAQTQPEPDPPAPADPPVVQSVDDFVPDGGLDRSFLEDSLPTKTKMDPQPVPASLDSDSEGEEKGGNPMVAGYQDDLDPDDTAPGAGPKPPNKALDIALSSDEEEEKETAPAVTQDEDPDVETDEPLESMNTLTLEDKPSATETAPPTERVEENAGSQSLEAVSSAPILSPTPAAPAPTPPKHQSHSKEETAQAESSDTDQDVPVARQMLSFIMDDPDFESDEDKVQKVAKDSFPARAELPDLSDDDTMTPAQAAEPPKSSIRSFKSQDDGDLFGLGFEEKSVKSKDSSEEQDERESKHSTKEKKKKKKKSKEEEDKSGKKRHKHKKKEKEEAGGSGDQKEKEKKKKKSRSKKTSDVDDLEAFLAGGEGSAAREDGDYEEL